MPPLKFFPRKGIAFITLCCAQLFSVNLQAVEFEISSMVGQTFSPELINASRTDYFSATDEPNIALAFSWQDSPTEQGQVLINYISRDFSDDITQTAYSFDTLYTHFNGVVFFEEKNYITTASLGLGATYFNSDFDDVIYPSVTASVGTRYEFSNSLAFITELRTYITLTENDDSLFCQNETCLAYFKHALWVDSQISIGLAYSF